MNDSPKISRNLYLLAGSFVLFSVVSCGLSTLPNSLQPNLPANGSLWKMVGLAFFVAALLTTLVAVLTAMFEQVERRNQERMRKELNEDLAQLSRNNRRK
jgi:hypothetical protein